MSTACRVSIEIDQMLDKEWDCTCDTDNPDVRCYACVMNDEDYFDEED